LALRAALPAALALCLPWSAGRADTFDLAGDNLVTDGTFTSLASGVSTTTGGYVCDNTKATCSSALTDWNFTCASGGCPGTASPGTLLIRGTNGAYFNPSYTVGVGLYWSGIGDAGTAGNEIALDGGSSFSQTMSQNISGLVTGQNYLLQFYQAAAQEHDRSGATTEQWRVSLGGTTVLAPNQNTASQSASPWTLVSLEFTANAPTGSELLSFLSSGTPDSEPPIVLLGDVSLYQDIPEPGTMALIGAAMLAIGVARRRRA
jgi:hypothetical protein